VSESFLLSNVGSTLGSDAFQWDGGLFSEFR